MNIPKHIHYIISFSAGLLLMSCLNENEPESFFPTLATVNMEGNQVELESDSYGRLAVENPEVLKAGDADSTGQRVLGCSSSKKTSRLKARHLKSLLPR